MWNVMVATEGCFPRTAHLQCLRLFELTQPERIDASTCVAFCPFGCPGTRPGTQPTHTWCKTVVCVCVYECLWSLLLGKHFRLKTNCGKADFGSVVKAWARQLVFMVMVRVSLQEISVNLYVTSPKVTLTEMRRECVGVCECVLMDINGLNAICLQLCKLFISF